MLFELPPPLGGADAEEAIFAANDNTSAIAEFRASAKVGEVGTGEGLAGADSAPTTTLGGLLCGDEDTAQPLPLA